MSRVPTVPTVPTVPGVLGVIFIALVLSGAWPAVASAQVGLGMRLAWVKPNVDVEPAPDATRFIGAHLRARLSPHTGVELSYDWHTEENEAKTLRTRQRPFQGTLLVHFLSGNVSPYLLGGVGWYNVKIETLDGTDTVLETASDTTFGYHLGLGGEIKAGRHFGFHVDYRYKFIHTDEEADSGVPIVGGILDRFGLDRSGSVWTGGATLYF